MRTLDETRFGGLFTSQSPYAEFTSLDSRLEILSGFYRQFSVSPILEIFKQKLFPGAGAGYYLHSLPLSFLTHTGLIGFLLVLTSIIFGLRNRIFIGRSNSLERNLSYYFTFDISARINCNFLYMVYFLVRSRHFV